MSLAELEARMANLERKVDQFAAQAARPVSGEINAWIDQVHDTFQDDVAYRRAAQLGRQWRRSQRDARAPAARPAKAAAE